MNFDQLLIDTQAIDNYIFSINFPLNFFDIF